MKLDATVNAKKIWDPIKKYKAKVCACVCAREIEREFVWVGG